MTEQDLIIQELRRENKRFAEREKGGRESMVFPKDRCKVYQKVLDTYGAQMQTVIAMEEMAELVKELSKSLRGANNVDQIAEEIADVRIMLDQMELLHDCAGLTANYKTAKIERLAERLRGCCHG